MESVKGALGRWGRRVAEAAKKTESLAGNTWQHREFSFFFKFTMLIVWKLELLYLCVDEH